MPVVRLRKRSGTTRNFIARLDAIRPDAIIVVAYGRIIPEWMLRLPRWGSLNPSPPRYSQMTAAPPPSNGRWPMVRPLTAPTTMRLGRRPPRHRRHSPAARKSSWDPTKQPSDGTLARKGAKASLMLQETLDGSRGAGSQPVPQGDAAASDSAPIPARRRGCSTGRLRPICRRDFTARWRFCRPWPGAYAFFRGKKLTLHRLMPAGPTAVPPGELVVERDRLFVGAGSATRLELLEVQLEGKKRMPVADFLSGTAPHPHEKLTA